MKLHISTNASPNHHIGQVTHITDREAQAIDELQDRGRITKDELNAMIALNAIMNLCHKQEMLLEKYARKCGTWRDLRCITTMLDRVTRTMHLHISTKQLVSIMENTRNAELLISTVPAEPNVTLSMRDAEQLCHAARYYCRFACMKNEAETRTCPLRSLLSRVPVFIYRSQENDPVLPGVCEYAFKEEDHDA